MKTRLYLQPTPLEATKAMLKDIDNSDFDINHIVVVPDRFSLQAEKMILEFLPNKSTFNVEVRGLTSFALKSMKEMGVSFQTISQEECLLLTEMAFNLVKNKLISFKRGNIHFIEQIYKVISQIESSAVEPSELLSAQGSLSLRNKFHDIALVYEKYLELRSDRLDANAILCKFKEQLELYNVLNKTHVYFAMFDSFTQQTYQLIDILIPSALSINVAAPKSSSYKNQYIYDDDILNKIQQLAKRYSLEVEVLRPLPKYNRCQELIINNLFGGNIERSEIKDYFTSISFSSKWEEVTLVAKLVKNFLRKGKRYKDIVIACGNLQKYSAIIEELFNQENIAFFIDQSENCAQTAISQMVMSFLQVPLMRYSKVAVTNFFANQIFSDMNASVIDKIDRLGIDDKFGYKKYISKENHQIEYFFSSLEKSNTTHEFCDVLEEFLSFVAPYYLKFLELSEKNYYLKEKSINSQAFDLVLQILQELKNFDASGQTDLKQFLYKMKLIMGVKEVSAAPCYVDAIMVSDVTAGYFEENQIIFILGANDLPTICSDLGLISDDELTCCKLKKKIEPSIRMINRRNRFKLFALCSLAREKLIVSYLTINEEGKKNEVPAFVSELENIFAGQSLRGRTLSSLYQGDKNEMFLLSLGSKQWTKKELAFYKDNISGNVAVLKKVVAPEYEKYMISHQFLSNKIKNDYFRVTQLECYFACPYKHFVRYILKPKEKEENKFTAKDLGNICHKFAEIYVLDKYILKLGKFDNYIKEKFDYVLESLNLTQMIELSKDKVVLIEYIFSAVNLLFKKIDYELSNSNFKPAFVEKKLELPLKVCGENIKLVGKVDRIDESEEYFRIIDYKTGNVSGIIKDLYYGDKLQLFLYQNAVAKQLNKRRAGSFYFDSKWDYSSADDNQCILKGYTCDDNECIKLFDIRLGNIDRSDIIAISTTSGKKSAGIYKGSAISKTDFRIFESYAGKVAEVAIQEILSGYIAPKPSENECEMCEYKGICLYDATHGYRKKERITSKTIEKIIEGGGNE